MASETQPFLCRNPVARRYCHFYNGDIPDKIMQLPVPPRIKNKLGTSPPATTRRLAHRTLIPKAKTPWRTGQIQMQIPVRSTARLQAALTPKKNQMRSTYLRTWIARMTTYMNIRRRSLVNSSSMRPATQANRSMRRPHDPPLWTGKSEALVRRNGVISVSMMPLEMSVTRPIVAAVANMDRRQNQCSTRRRALQGLGTSLSAIAFPTTFPVRRRRLQPSLPEETSRRVFIPSTHASAPGARVRFLRPP
jgi:hypothetical protein